jgi:hypothetical protein
MVIPSAAEVRFIELFHYHLSGPTQNGRRSFVQALVDQPQPADWYVIHPHAQQPIAQLVRCLEKHASDRQLGEHATYWIAAFALRRYDTIAPSPELRQPLEERSWVRAMECASGAVLLVNVSGPILSRAWCCLELWQLLSRTIPEDPEQQASLLDVYTLGSTAAKGWAVGTRDEGDGAVEPESGPPVLEPRGGKAAFEARGGKATHEARGSKATLEPIGGKQLEPKQLNQQREFPIDRLVGVLDLRLRHATAASAAELESIRALLPAARLFESTAQARIGCALLPKLLAESWHPAGRSEHDALALLELYCRALAASQLRQLTMRKHALPISAERCRRLVDAVPPCLERLHLLGLLPIDAMAEQLAALLRRTTALSHLHVLGAGLGAAGTTALSRSLGACDTLRELLLTANRIGDSGALSLCRALRRNRTLLVLGLAENGIADDGAFALADALEINRTLTELDLRRNCIGDDGAIALSRVLPANLELRALRLQENGTGYNGRKALQEAAEAATAIRRRTAAQDRVVGELRVEYGDLFAGLRAITPSMASRLLSQRQQLPNVRERWRYWS